jgi:hypothetical protein
VLSDIFGIKVSILFTYLFCILHFDTLNIELELDGMWNHGLLFNQEPKPI